MKITQNQVLHQFPSWGPSFEISFELFLGKIEKDKDYMSVLTLTTNRGKCCKLGERVPGVLLKTVTQQFHIGTQIGTNGNQHATSSLKYEANKGYHFKIRQFESSGKTVLFSIINKIPLITFIFSILKLVLMGKHSFNAQKIPILEHSKMYI